MSERSSKIRRRRTGTHLDIDLVAAKDNGDVLADALQITMPVRHVLVCDTRRDIKHDDTALALNVVTISESTKLLLSSSVPDVEDNVAVVGVESERVHLDA